VKPQIAAIIPAAGSGLRLAADDGATGPPKALRRLAGETLLRHAVHCIEHVADEIVVAAPSELVAQITAELAPIRKPVRVVVGGSTRQESVRRALGQVKGTAAFVLVHDAARPMVPPDVVDRVLAALTAGAVAVVPAVPVSDSLRQVGEEGASTALDRHRVRAVQTPQGFRAATLRAAHEQAPDEQATDDASLVERLGEPVTLVEGDLRGFKITRAIDLVVAESLARRQR
jgi:2-C-methyl-D-erythritol 4-phosphate cytidylyltransferase